MKAIVLIIVVTVTALLLSFVFRTEAQQEVAINDEDVRVAHFEDMSYPAGARLAPSHGVVVVRLTLDDEGRVLTATAISGAKYLVPDSLANAKKWRFQVRTGGVAIIVYYFRILSGMCNSPTSQFTFEPPNLALVTTCEQPVQH